MLEREYINALKILYEGANEHTIKIWSREPSYSSLQRTIRLVKHYGYNELYFTCRFTNQDLKKVGLKNDVIIYDQADAISKCQLRLDLLKIIEKGI